MQKGKPYKDIRKKVERNVGVWGGKTMDKSSFVPKTVVKIKDGGQIGAVCPDLPGPLSCNGPEEVSVVYEGDNVAIGTDWHRLEIIGPEKAKADLLKCGAGRGEDACIFLTVGSNGAECQRFESMRWNLIFQTMKAKRNPVSLYPKCQFSN